MTPHSGSSPSSAFRAESDASLPYTALGGQNLTSWVGNAEKPLLRSMRLLVLAQTSAVSRRGRPQSRTACKICRAGRFNSSNGRGFFQPADHGRRLYNGTPTPKMGRRRAAGRGGRRRVRALDGSVAPL